MVVWRHGHPPILHICHISCIIIFSLYFRSRGINHMKPKFTNVLHVFPFEVRVKMFHEFVKLDKSSRRMTQEVVGPRPRYIEITVLCDHIVEDGFSQLNSLRSKLKYCINVYFLMNVASQIHGWIMETCSRSLWKIWKRWLLILVMVFLCKFPHPKARLLGNGIKMIKFLRVIVGKDLYEGILMD